MEIDDAEVAEDRKDNGGVEMMSAVSQVALHEEDQTEHMGAMEERTPELALTDSQEMKTKKKARRGKRGKGIKRQKKTAERTPALVMETDRLRLGQPQHSHVQQAQAGQRRAVRGGGPAPRRGPWTYESPEHWYQGQDSRGRRGGQMWWPERGGGRGGGGGGGGGGGQMWWPVREEGGFYGEWPRNEWIREGGKRESERRREKRKRKWK
ncbi:mRNA 3'-end-processing protein yth-1-like [Alosa alosa]|nr:mRNA 3'-end-processing protein yth-1-like [Alosa alosa]